MPWTPQDDVILVQLRIPRIDKELLFCKESHLGGSVFNKNFPREQVQSQANTMRVLIEMQETLMFEYNEVLKLHKAISYTPYFHS